MLVQPFATPFVQAFPNPFGSHNQPSAPVAPEQPRELSLPRYVNYLADYSGCGFWRILWFCNIYIFCNIYGFLIILCFNENGLKVWL